MARSATPAEITLGLGKRYNVAFMGNRLYMLLEKLKHLIKALHKSLSQSAAHRHDFYPRLFVTQLVHIALPSRSD